MRNKKFVLLVLIPMCMHLIIFMFLPILGNVGISFFEYNPLRADNSFVGLDNYIKMLGDKVFIKALINTLVFVFATAVLNIIIALAVASLISQLKSNKTRSLFRMVAFLPCIAPLVAGSVVWLRSIFPTNSGLLNMVIKALGADSINWLGSSEYLMVSVILFTLWADIGYNIILFSAGIDGIPGEFYQASSIDGAGRWKQFKNLTLPLLGRTLTFVIVMTLISHFQMFAQFNVLAYKGMGPQQSGLVLTSYIYKTAFEHKEMGYASAISMALFVIILVITLIHQRLSKVNWEY